MRILKTHKKGELYTNGRIVVMCTESNQPTIIGGDPTILSGVCVKGNDEVDVGEYSTVWVRSFFDPL